MTGRRKGTPCACETDPCNCGSSKGKCIRAINNLSPDANGDFIIEAGSGITIIQTGDNSLEVSFDGVFPSNPLIYKGTVGSGGTIPVLPAADSDNIGWMYIAIEAATSPVTYDVGDVLISDGYTWQVVPSGDEIIPIVTAWQATPDDQHVPSEKLTKDSLDLKADKTQLSDGSVTKIGVSTVGGNLKPIYLNAGVPTAVPNNFVDVSSAQTVTGAKTYTSRADFKISPYSWKGPTNTFYLSNAIQVMDGDGDYVAQFYPVHDADGTNHTDITVRAWDDNQGTNAYRGILSLISKSNGDMYATVPNRTYNPSNTSDIVNISLLDAYTPMVRTTGNQTIAGNKNYTNSILLNTIGSIKHTRTGDADMIDLEIANSQGNTKAILRIGAKDDGNPLMQLRKWDGSSWTTVWTAP